MIYDMLKRLLMEGRLKKCTITLLHKHSANGQKTIHGRNILGITRSGIKYSGGESGHESFRVPLDHILGIEFGCKPVYKKKKRIEKVYPRA